MIEQADVDQRQGLLDAVGDELVRVAGFGDPGGVIVRDDDGGTVPLEGALDHLARMHAGPVNGAAKQLLELDQPVPVVELW